MREWRTKATEIAESLGLILLAAWVMAKPLVDKALELAAAALAAASAYWASLDLAGKKKVVLGALGILALMFVWSWREVPSHWLAYQTGKRPLYDASNWHYQLDKAVVDDLAKNNADVLVIDYATSGGKVPLTAAEVARLKTRADGRKRLVIAYMSIGEAESYRFYFREDWKTDPPDWLGIENCSWPGAYKVMFWHDTWKDIVWRGRNAYLKKIIAAGFDGVYLDRVDIYDQYPDNPVAREQMIAFVTDLSAMAKKLKPGFLVIPQNADDLLVEPEYRAVIDGLGREDLLYGVAETGKRNPARGIDAAQKRLDLLLWEWKAVLAVEYMQTPKQIADVTKELNQRGLVATIQPRGLDGTDPTAPIDLSKDVGTSEYTRKNCGKHNSW